MQSTLDVKHLATEEKETNMNIIQIIRIVLATLKAMKNNPHYERAEHAIQIFISVIEEYSERDWYPLYCFIGNMEQFGDVKKHVPKLRKMYKSMSEFMDLFAEMEFAMTEEIKTLYSCLDTLLDIVRDIESTSVVTCKDEDGREWYVLKRRTL